jgi:hypothetical protein
MNVFVTDVLLPVKMALLSLYGDRCSSGSTCLHVLHGLAHLYKYTNLQRDGALAKLYAPLIQIFHVSST